MTNSRSAPTLSDSELKTLQQLKDLQTTQQHLVIISDAGRDHDDEVALTVAAGLSKLGLLKIEGVVANLKPAESRARLIKGILNTVGLTDVPVGIGTAIDENSFPQPYEFNASYISEEKDFPDGQNLLKQLLEKSPDKSLTLLLISGLTDANIFLEKNKELAQQKLQSIVIMGGVVSEQNNLKYSDQGNLLPDESYNHKVDMASAKSFYLLAQQAEIPLRIVSRFCAMACAISPQFYDRLAKEDSPIGKRLCSAQADAIQHLWKRVFLAADDKHREGLPPYCNKEWFLKTFTNNSAALQTSTANDSMWHHVEKLNAYDPIALLAAVVPNLFHPMEAKVSNTVHSAIGINANNPGVTDPEKIRSVLTGLALWGLSASPQQELKLNSKEKTTFDFYKPAENTISSQTNNLSGTKPKL